MYPTRGIPPEVEPPPPTYNEMDTKNTSQPKASSGMVLSVQPSIEQGQLEAQQNKHKSMRLRGGGAGKDCFLGALECFLCFECCKDCCECWADILCCPCEMCC